jgi:small subunit ribosomal protein S16
MVKLRLRRTGAKKRPNYRVVVADSRSPRDGRFIEVVGHYNPRTDPPTTKIYEDRALHWLSVGAQPTATVQKLLTNLGTMDRFARVKEGVPIEEVLQEAQEMTSSVSKTPTMEEKTPDVAEDVLATEAVDSTEDSTQEVDDAADETGVV